MPPRRLITTTTLLFRFGAEDDLLEHAAERVA